MVSLTLRSYFFNNFVSCAGIIIFLKNLVLKIIESYLGPYETTFPLNTFNNLAVESFFFLVIADYICILTQHWKHLCECKSRKLHLLYRHTLAELNDLLLTLDRCNPEEMPGINSLKRQISSSNQMSSLSKKV